jgi:hypothetical protein
MKKFMPAIACLLAIAFVTACAAGPAPATEAKFKIFRQGQQQPAKGDGNGTQPYLNSSNHEVELSIDGEVLGKVSAFDDCTIWGPKGSHTLIVTAPDGTSQNIGLAIIN